LIKWLGL